MPSSHLDSTHDQTILTRHALFHLDYTQGRKTSGIACHHRPCAAHTIRRRQALDVIIALGQHTQKNTSGVASHLSLGQQIWSDDVRRGMPSSPLDNTHGRTTSSIKWHNCPRKAYTVGLRQAWHVIIALGQHTWSDDVKCGMPPWPLGSTHGGTTSGMAMLSFPLGSSHTKRMLIIKCHYCPWTTYMAELL